MRARSAVVPVDVAHRERAPAGREVLAGMLASLLDVPGRLATLEHLLARVLQELDAIRQSLPPSLVSVREAARHLGVSVPTVRRLIKSGGVVAVRIGGSVRIDLSRLQPVDEEQVAVLARQAREPRPDPGLARQPLRRAGDNSKDDLADTSTVRAARTG